MQSYGAVPEGPDSPSADLNPDPTHHPDQPVLVPYKRRAKRHLMWVSVGGVVAGVILLVVLGVVLRGSSSSRNAPPFPDASRCLGSFELCPDTQACVLFSEDCARCSCGQFLCPNRWTCVDTADDYVQCPGLTGTHLDWTLSEEQRLDYLVRVTELEEKVHQLTNDAPAIERLGIPAYNWRSNDQHGVKQPHATSFPNGCALGATWSKQTLRNVGTAIGLEARGLYNGFTHMGLRGHGKDGMGVTLYTPNLNLVRDPRWGRSQEVFSEDPLLMSRLTYMFVTGIQKGNEDDEETPFLLAGACCKHFAAYDVDSIPVLRYNFSAEVDVRNMWETYLPAFKACVVEAHGSHVMCSYNAINGIPTCGTPDLLNGILRDQWNWDGFVISDLDAWAQIYETHLYCPDYECAARVGINAGMDQEDGGTRAIDRLPHAVEHGTVQPQAIDNAFRRLFRIRMRLGMFDPPTMVPHNYVTNSSRVVLSQEHQQLARKAAQEAMCLYKNDGNILPLDRASLHTIALIGPQASDGLLLLGNYAWGTGPDVGIVSIQDGMEAALKQTQIQLLIEPGCLDIACTSTEGFVNATTAAQSADVTVVLLGLDQNVEAEGLDRENIDLPGNQVALVEALRTATAGKPLIAVLIHGGTLAVGDVLAHVDAMVDAWYPGMMGGHGVADVLFGEYNPAGRVPVTYYQATSQLPAMERMDLYAKEGVSLGITYRFFTGQPQLAFGFGLSYTTFAYSDLKVTPQNVEPCETIHVTVTVTNTGGRAGDEVVQVYVKQPDASVPAPRVRLVDFARIHLAQGASQTVSLSIAPDFHSVVLDGPNIYKGQVIVEAGKLDVFVGGGQPDYYDGHISASVDITRTSSC